jgi:hypothetical protein
MHKRGWQATTSKTKKTPVGKPGVFFLSYSLMKFHLAHYDNVGCLWAFRTIGNLELYLIAFIEGFKSISLNGRKVYEDIISVVSGNEPIALLLIKPFHTTFGHYNSPPFFF